MAGESLLVVWCSTKLILEVRISPTTIEKFKRKTISRSLRRNEVINRTRNKDVFDGDEERFGSTKSHGLRNYNHMEVFMLVFPMGMVLGMSLKSDSFRIWFCRVWKYRYKVLISFEFKVSSLITLFRYWRVIIMNGRLYATAFIKRIDILRKHQYTHTLRRSVKTSIRGYPIARLGERWKRIT